MCSSKSNVQQYFKKAKKTIRNIIKVFTSLYRINNNPEETKIDIKGNLQNRVQSDES